MSTPQQLSTNLGRHAESFYHFEVLRNCEEARIVMNSTVQTCIIFISFVEQVYTDTSIFIPHAIYTPASGIYYGN